MFLIASCSSSQQMGESYEGRDSSNSIRNNTQAHIKNKIDILDHIQNESFEIYSLNLASTAIDKTIHRKQDKALRSYLYQGLSSGILLGIHRQNSSSSNDSSLHVHLAPQAYHGKNVELIFPSIHSNKAYTIEIEGAILSKIQQLLGITLTEYQ